MKLIFPLLTLMSAGFQAGSAPASEVVNICYDAKVTTLQFATSELAIALKAAKLQPVVSSFDEKPANKNGWTVIVGLLDRLKLTNPALATLTLSEEGFALRPFPEKKLIYIVGADTRGAMYGTLEVTESVEMGAPLSDVKAKTEKPSMPIQIGRAHV